MANEPIFADLDVQLKNAVAVMTAAASLIRTYSGSASDAQIIAVKATADALKVASADLDAATKGVGGTNPPPPPPAWTLRVNADNATRPFQTSNAEPTFSLVGFMNGQDTSSAGVTGKPVITNATSAVSDAPVGSTHPIHVVSIGTLVAPGYTFEVGTDGVLTITA